jgi:glycosyltransferase involved in cell wall biosynthesis
MKLHYIANVRLPTEKAHGVQIMKTCEAFVRSGATVELVVPARHTPIKEDAFTYYEVENIFSIRKLPVLDLIFLGRVGFWIESISFALFALLYSLSKQGVIYSRDELPLYLISFFKKNIVWESHTGRYNFLARRLLRVCSQVVVISDGLKRLYESKGRHTKIVVAPDGIELAAFAHPESAATARTRLGLPIDQKIALYIGRLDGWKGTDTLLNTAQYLSGTIRVVIIGGEEAQVKKLRAKYPQVIFVGFRPYRELADNQAAADVLVLPNTGKDEISAQFTSPMKLFSYMAAGKPIIASDLPSLREVLNEQSAFFATPDDPMSFARAIEQAIGDQGAASRVAEKAHADVASYTWEERTKKILAAINS